MTDTPALVTIDSLGVEISGHRILSDISFSIGAGEIITLIGPNGAGKSTLIRTLLGLVQPTSGQCHKRPGLRIGYMPQRLQMDRTIPMQVTSFLEIWRLRKSIPVHQALHEVGASHLSSRPMHSLSGGELQRVLLARALLRRPHLLVLDEPVQGVDLQGQAEIYQLIKTISQQYDCAILMVSHDLHLVMSATDRVICMNHHICCSGHPELVSNDPAYLELFGKEAIESIALYAHHHDHQHDDAGQVVCSGNTQDG